MGTRWEKEPLKQPVNVQEVIAILKEGFAGAVENVEISDIENTSNGLEFYVTLPIEHALGSRYTNFCVSVEEF